MERAYHFLKRKISFSMVISSHLLWALACSNRWGGHRWALGLGNGKGLAMIITEAKNWDRQGGCSMFSNYKLYIYRGQTQNMKRRLWAIAKSSSWGERPWAGVSVTAAQTVGEGELWRTQLCFVYVFAITNPYLKFKKNDLRYVLVIAKT